MSRRLLTGKSGRRAGAEAAISKAGHCDLVGATRCRLAGREQGD